MAMRCRYNDEERYERHSFRKGEFIKDEEINEMHFVKGDKMRKPLKW